MKDTSRPDIPIHYVSLAKQVERMLINRISGGSYPPGSQLPPENQLAEELQVSRSTIRAAFNALEGRKYLVRKQGVGTFVSQAARISNPLNQSINFLELIASNGYKPAFQQLSAEINRPDQHRMEQLQLAPTDRVLEVHKVFTADGNPVIYSINYIPTRVFQDHLSEEEALQPGMTEPFFDFFTHRCRIKIKYYLSTVKVALGSDYPFLIKHKVADPQSPILVIDETGFDQDDRPANSALEFLPGKMMNFSLIRHCEIK